MIDRDFCNFLEYRLTRAFANLTNNPAHMYWYDGVLETSANYSKKYVNDNRHVELMAYAGPDGQATHKLILFFGRKALSRYARGLNISCCVPYPETTNWLHIDNENKIIYIHLD